MFNLHHVVIPTEGNNISITIDRQKLENEQISVWFRGYGLYLGGEAAVSGHKNEFIC